MTKNGTEHLAFSKQDFGEDFKWGVSTSAYQIEGAHDKDGKGPSIWDRFTQQKKTIYGNHNGNIACDFYHRYTDDLALLNELQFKNFRFSIAWSRILPEGVGHINVKGLDFYDRLIDACLNLGITPWVTLYHWDLPEALEKKGGWTNRQIVNWFEEYVEVCLKVYGDRVKYWMVLNEPMVFTGAGYFFGVHAPGKKGLKNFLPAMHHAALCQAIGAKVVKSIAPEAEVGTTFSSTLVEPYRQNVKDEQAAHRVDALLNRMLMEPMLGMGYPTEGLRLFEKIEQYYRSEDEKKMVHDFDFIGLQNYTREMVRHSLFTPLIRAKIINAKRRKVAHTLMNWEIYPEAIYKELKRLSAYPGIKKIYVTENGAAFKDQLKGNTVRDSQRVEFLKSYLNQVLRAKKEGVNVAGYFVWTFTDNFEWAEGYYPRFGLVYVDFKSQQRIVKSSAKWMQSFIS